LQTYNSQIDVRSESYKNNYDKMFALVEELSVELKKSLYQGEEKSMARHQAQGKLLARDRIELLLDQDSPFLELMPMAGFGQAGISPGASLVAGIGLVNGIECLVSANVPTIKGGAINQYTLLKMQRLAQISLENRLPHIYLVESAGADLPNQAEIYNYGGAEFRSITQRSRKGIPSISIVFGSSTAGGAYIPGMSDYVIMVKEQAKVYLAGPPLVKMAINEEVDDETLGGASMHAKLSGVADYLAENEEHALYLARDIVSQLNHKKAVHLETLQFKEVKLRQDEILGIASADVRTPFDAREIIARIVDGSEFSEFKPLYGSSLVTVFGEIYGQPVGILANNGVLLSESAEKGAQFIQLCNQKNVPLIFLQNITGFMVGQKVEQQGIIKHGAELINAVSNSAVPAITILMGASFGAGNYGMSGRAFAPRFLFSWPNAQLGVMGAEQLAGVMDILAKQKEKKMSGQKESETGAKAKVNGQADLLRQKIEKESHAFYCTGRIWDDGIIDPRDTRQVLGVCLSVIANNKVEGSAEYGVFRM